MKAYILQKSLHLNLNHLQILFTYKYLFRKKCTVGLILKGFLMLSICDNSKVDAVRLVLSSINKAHLHPFSQISSIKIGGYN
ncbi:hypothetical protein FKM82_006021 [Ascaphus truei]